MAKPMGMMSGCYFVGRAELLEWVNELLQLNYDKVEDTSNGAAFCQIIDAIHPGTVSLGRVNYNAVSEAEMVENYKILQDAFNKNGITQYIDVSTLVKGKYMAALELFQWIHGYYEQQGGVQDYDAVGRRKQTHCKEPNSRGRINKKPAGMAKRHGGMGAAGARLQADNKNKNLRPGVIPGTVEAKQIPKKAAMPKRAHDEQPRAAQKPAASKPAPAGGAASSAEVKELKHQIAELKEELEQMNQERDFYYEKLRKIEDFCQDNEDESVIQSILNILYEADEEKGFLPPDDEDDADE